MTSNDMKTIATRLREYLRNAHHVDPISERFKTLIIEAADAFSTLSKLQPQGEPVAYRCRHSATEPWFFSDKPGYWEWQALYAEQPAPVEIVLPECMNVPEADCPERINAQGWNACLDELKRLNPSL